jgi:hypothetical protein
MGESDSERFGRLLGEEVERAFEGLRRALRDGLGGLTVLAQEAAAEVRAARLAAEALAGGGDGERKGGHGRRDGRRDETIMHA